MRNQTTSMLSLFFLTNIHLCCWENKHATPQNKKNKKQGRSMIGLNGPTIDWSKNCSNKKNPIMNGTSGTFRSSKVFWFLNDLIDF